MGPVIHNPDSNQSKIVYVRLPYIGPCSDKIAKNLRKCINNVCKDGINMKITLAQTKMSAYLISS